MLSMNPRIYINNSELVYLGMKFEMNATFWPAGLILGLRPANESRRYFVMVSLIGWAQT